MARMMRRPSALAGLPGELLAEFLGTMVLILFGDGVVAMVVLFGKGTYENITWSWGLGVTLGVYIAGAVSGAHLNPAVTVALALRRGFAWSKVIPYAIAQIAGAFVAALLLFIDYRGGFDAYEKVHHIVRGTAAGVGDAGVFSTYPGTFPGSVAGTIVGTVGNGTALFDQILGTALLVGLIFAVTDTRNTSPLSNLAPFIIGLIVVAIGLSFGADAGYAINPARDFGPRLFASLAGWGSAVYSAGNYYFWVPIVGPLIGGAVGAFVYDYAIANVLVARGAVANPDVTSKGEDVIDNASAATATGNRA